MLASKYRKIVTTLSDTWKFSAPENSPNYDPTIGEIHSEFNNSRIKATHK